WETIFPKPLSQRRFGRPIRFPRTEWKRTGAAGNEPGRRPGADAPTAPRREWLLLSNSHPRRHDGRAGSIGQRIVHPRAQPTGFLTRQRVVLLFFSLLTFFVLVPIVHQLRAMLHPRVPPLLEGFGFVVVLGGAIASVSSTRAGKLLAVSLALPTGLLIVLQSLSDAVWITILHHVFSGV